jgi:hypothetical protein
LLSERQYRRMKKTPASDDLNVPEFIRQREPRNRVADVFETIGIGPRASRSCVSTWLPAKPIGSMKGISDLPIWYPTGETDGERTGGTTAARAYRGGAG